VYVETSVVSYLVSHLSKAPLILGQQQVTKKWWHQVMDQYTPFTSEMVYTEAARGGFDHGGGSTQRPCRHSVARTRSTDHVAGIGLSKRIGFPESLRPDA